MPDSTPQSVLLELVSKNYTGDSQGYEKTSKAEVPVSITPAPVPFFESPVPEPLPSSPVVPLAMEPIPEMPAEMAITVDDPSKKLSKQEERELRQ